MIPLAVLAGLCEGSGMVLDPDQPDTVYIADNERSDQLFRYTLDGVPLQGLGSIGLGQMPLSEPIEDIEALAADATNLWIVGSQSHSKSGTEKPLRERIVRLHGAGPTTWTVDWTGCALCKGDDFGGLRNVEGAAFWTAHLWLGLRAPLVEGRALLVELTPRPNSSVFDVTASYAIDLGGLAIVDLSVNPAKPDALWILAGSSTGKATPHIFELAGPAATPKMHSISLPEDAEGFVVLATGGVRVVTDGSTGKDGACKTTSTFYRADKL